MAFEERTILCADCGNEFKFTVEEQEFYSSKGFENEPKRCMECRRMKRRQRHSRSRSASPRFAAPSGIYRIICDACQKQDTVPFPPRADKPVYCNDCFAKVKSGEISPARPYLTPRAEDAELMSDSIAEEITEANETTMPDSNPENNL